MSVDSIVEIAKIILAPLIAGFLGGIIGARIQARTTYKRETLNVLRETIAEFQGVAVGLNIEKFSEHPSFSISQRRLYIEKMATLLNKVALLLDTTNEADAELQKALQAVTVELAKDRGQTTPEHLQDLLDQVCQLGRTVLASRFRNISKRS